MLLVRLCRRVLHVQVIFQQRETVVQITAPPTAIGKCKPIPTLNVAFLGEYGTFRKELRQA